MAATRNTTGQPYQQQEPPGLLLPKPQGALRIEHARRAGLLDGDPKVSTALRGVLRHIVQNGDLLDVTQRVQAGTFRVWLLVPMPSHVLEALMAFESDDLELEDHDFEDLDEDDDNSDREPDLGSCEQIWQERWGVPQQRGLVIDGEHEDELFEDGDDEPSHGWSDWAPNWMPWAEDAEKEATHG